MDYLVETCSYLLRVVSLNNINMKMIDGDLFCNIKSIQTLDLSDSLSIFRIITYNSILSIMLKKFKFTVNIKNIKEKCIPNSIV